MKKLLLLLFVLLVTPMTIEAEPIQKIMGHYDSDSIASEGMSVGNNGTLSLAIILDPEELEIYQGGKIVAIRVGLAEATEITKVFVIPVLANNKYGTRTEWSCNVSEAGWNTVQLETPYDINLEADQKLLVGFYYKQTSGLKPISFVKVGLPYEAYTYTRVGSVNKWKEINSSGYGNLSLQCIVEKDSYPDYRIKAYGLLTNDFVQAGDLLPFKMELNNKGIKQIDANELVMNLLIDGERAATITNDDPFVDGYCTIYASAPTDGLETGRHVLTVQVVSIGGQPLEEPVSQEVEFFAYQQAYPRQKHLVEQLTSTYCTYCPLGNSMLNILTSQRDDIIWVGIHGNLGSGVDPFRSDQGDSIMVYMTGGSISYPSAAFDRSTGWEDDVNIVNSIGYYEEYHSLVAEYLGNFFDYITESMPTFAEINGDCSFNESTRMATVVVKGRVSPDFETMMGEDARLTVYLVEDSLVARQLNNGNWINNYKHHGVFRQALGKGIMGDPLNRISGRYKNVYRFSVPNSWNWNHLRVVAFISRPLSNYVNGYTDMFVNNAEMFKFSVSDAVEEIITDANAVPVEYYDMMGRKLDSLQQGINIVRMSDGTSRKVLVR